MVYHDCTWKSPSRSTDGSRLFEGECKRLNLEVFMKTKRTKILFGIFAIIILAIGFAVTSCEGPMGPEGPQGPGGPERPSSPNHVLKLSDNVPLRIK